MWLWRRNIRIIIDRQASVPVEKVTLVCAVNVYHTQIVPVSTGNSMTLLTLKSIIIGFPELNCGPDKIYVACAPCPRTCANYLTYDYTTLGCVCSPRCVCDSNRILSPENRCVPSTACAEFTTTTTTTVVSSEFKLLYDNHASDTKLSFFRLRKLWQQRFVTLHVITQTIIYDIYFNKCVNLTHETFFLFIYFFSKSFFASLTPHQLNCL